MTLALTGLACSGGFVPVQPKTVDPEVAELRRENVELQRRATVSEMEVARLQEEIARLREELKEQETRAATGGSGTVIADSDPVEGSLVGPSAPIEELDLEESELELSGEPYSGDPGGVTAPMAAPDPNDPQAMYDTGYTLFHQRRYSEAELQFHRFLELYPRTELSDNALFWIGESRYAMGDYPGALEAFTDTVQRFSSGNKVADALLKAGKCFEALQDPARARETYQELERLFPDSSAAAAARERLANLGS